MENQRFDAEGTDLNVFSPAYDHIVVLAFLKSKFLLLSQTISNLEETDRLGALVLSPAQIDFLISVIEFALPYGESEQKKELQVQYGLLLGLKSALDRVMFEKVG